MRNYTCRVFPAHTKWVQLNYGITQLRKSSFYLFFPRCDNIFLAEQHISRNTRPSCCLMTVLSLSLSLSLHLPLLPLLSFEAHFRFGKGFPICFLGRREREREAPNALERREKESRRSAAQNGKLRKIFSGENGKALQGRTMILQHQSTEQRWHYLALIIQRCIRTGNAAGSEWTSHFES